MALSKLYLSPVSDGYSFTDGSEVLSVKLDGGASRYRQDILNSSLTANVQWILTPNKYTQMRYFYLNTVKSGSLPFNIDLLLNDVDNLTETECHFVPGSFGLRSQRGLSYVVGATLELVQDEYNFDPLIVLFGNDWPYYNDLFDTIINTNIPGYFA